MIVLLALMFISALNAQSFFATPIEDLAASTYQGQQGGLYENGTNTVPADHDLVLKAAAANIVPRDTNGNPSPSGKIILSALGMSNTKMTWDPFITAAASNPGVNHTTLQITDCAHNSEPAQNWLSLSSSNWGCLTSKQIQALWLFQSDAIGFIRPPTLPAGNAEAYTFEANLGTLVRNAKVKAPNLQIIFLDTFTYSGWGCPLVPEPYAYEEGFSAKWLIQAQINQERTGVIDPIAGDLSPAVAPRLAWSYYQWASGPNVRSDLLTWLQSDVQSDKCHPSPAGANKIVNGPSPGNGLLPFFLTSPYTAWFRP